MQRLYRCQVLGDQRSSRGSVRAQFSHRIHIDQDLSASTSRATDPSPVQIIDSQVSSRVMPVCARSQQPAALVFESTVVASIFWRCLRRQSIHHLFNFSMAWSTSRLFIQGQASNQLPQTEFPKLIFIDAAYSRNRPIRSASSERNSASRTKASTGCPTSNSVYRPASGEGLGVCGEYLENRGQRIHGAAGIAHILSEDLSHHRADACLIFGIIHGTQMQRVDVCQFIPTLVRPVEFLQRNDCIPILWP